MANVPFQRNLTLNFVLGVTILGIVLLVLSLVASHRVGALIARDLTIRALREIELSGTDLLQPIENITSIAEAWAAEGWFEASDDGSLIRALRGVIGGTDAGLVGVRIAKPDGSELSAVRTEAGDVVTRTDPARPGEIQRTTYALGAQAVHTTIPDGRPPLSERAWYREAIAELERAPEASVEERRVVSKLGVLPSIGRQVLTVSIAITDHNGEPIVLAYDVLAASVFRHFSTIRIRESGEMSIFALDDRTGTLLHFEPSSEDAEVFVASDLKTDTGPSAAFVRGVAELPEGLVVRRFEYLGADWWGALEASDRGEERELWFAAVVPESELLGIRDPFVYVIIATAVMIGIGIVRARSLSDRYAGPVRALVSQSERMGRLDFNESDPIRSDIQELEVLARSQDRTRAALESFTETSKELAIARTIREFDSKALLAQSGAHELAVYFTEGEQPACELALAVDVADSPGTSFRSLVGVGEGSRTMALQLSAPTEAIDGAMLAREFSAVFRQSVRVRNEPSHVLVDLDHYCRERYPDLGVVSACCMAFDRDSDSISMAGTGDPTAFIAQAGHFEGISLEGPSLGRLSDRESFTTHTLSLPEGGILAVCPRRVVEALKVDRTPLGVEAVATAMSDAAGSSLGLDEIIERAERWIIEALNRDSRRHEIDLTIIAVRRRTSG